MTLLLRNEAAQAAIDAFLFKPFAWGSADCAALAIVCLTALGHRDPLAKMRGYTTAIGAKRTLRHLGHATIEGVLDAMGLERIAPASSLPGDIVAMPSDHGDGWPALGVNVGQNRVLGFFDVGSGGRGDFIALQAATSAWRVI